MNQSKTTAADFFIYLGILTGCYISTISLASVLFGLINKWLPDVSADMYYDGSYEGLDIKFALSALIIFFPVFIYLSKLATKSLTITPEKKEMWVRRWFYFLTVFLTSLAMATDLFLLVYSFINGEDLTFRFILKVLVVFLIAFGLFKFYLSELKRDVSVVSPSRKYLKYSAVVLVLAVIVTALVSIGSPAKQRKLNQDSQRIYDLVNISYEINDYYYKEEKLPTVLNDLLKNNDYYMPKLKDPVTDKNYEYIVVDSENYKLCAEFALPSMNSERTDIWHHNSGRECFERTVK